MSVIYIVLPLALVLGGSALAAFLWAVSRGQFDDLDTPAIRVALDDDADRVPSDGARVEAPRQAHDAGDPPDDNSACRPRPR